jgi:hypothetical protein
LVGTAAPLVGFATQSLVFARRSGMVSSTGGGHRGLGRMGNYRFERDTVDGAGQGASESLEADVERALAQIDWVDHFAINAESSNEAVVSVDVMFDEDWPDMRSGDPGLVGTVFHRLGLRTIARVAGGGLQAVATDPLSADELVGDDEDGLDLFQFED